MSVISSIKSSQNDFNRPHNKSYWGFDFDISLIDANSIRDKKNPSPTEERMLQFDLSKEEPIEEIIILHNKKDEGQITTEQVKEILSDMGFDVNPTFGGKHFADIEAVMNIGGYSIPGWVKVARTIAKFLPSREKLLFTKLSPGKDRLHVVAYDEHDGSWVFASHTDYNWLNLNLPKIYKAHVGHGSGDYITGTSMFYNLLAAFGKSASENRILSVKEIKDVIQEAYNRSIIKKFNSH
jgi:hypothetical protein